MNLNTSLKPQAKLANLVVQDLSNEILIYNLENNKAFSLNETTTLVWQNCDGTKDVRQIAQILETNLGQTVPDELVFLALDRLKKEDLVAFDESDVSPLQGINRREVVKRVGLATMVALPIISSVVAPTASHAQSGIMAAICFVCVKKSDGLAACSGCTGELGTCYDNAGCGGGTLLTNTSCEACHDGTVSASLMLPFNGTVSWVANPAPPAP